MILLMAECSKTKVAIHLAFIVLNSVEDDSYSKEVQLVTNNEIYTKV